MFSLQMRQFVRIIAILAVSALLILAGFYAIYPGARTALQEELTGETPSAKITAYVRAIKRRDRPAALALWELPDWPGFARDAALTRRRDLITTNLLNANLNPDFTILNIEWWGTCCESRVIYNSRDAGGARALIQFLDASGSPLSYTFDLFTREQPYWGEVMDYPPRQWVIRDIYPTDEAPLFWQQVSEPQIRHLGP